MENVDKEEDAGAKKLIRLGKEEDLLSHLEKARKELALLKEKQELVEREEEELDGLRAQNEELARDRREVYDALSSRIAGLEEEELKAKGRHQEISATGRLLKNVLKGLETADKDGKKTSDVRQMISIGREAVDKARETLDRFGPGSEDEAAEYEAVSGRGESPLSLDMREAFRVGIGFFLAGALVTIVLYILKLIFRV